MAGLSFNQARKVATIRDKMQSLHEELEMAGVEPELQVALEECRERIVEALSDSGKARVDRQANMEAVRFPADGDEGDEG